MATSSISMGGISYRFTWKDSDDEHYLCEEHLVYRDSFYVILDMKADPFEIYPVESGKKFKIRLNDVSISSDDKDFTIDIVSHLFDKEMEELKGDEN